MFHRRHAAAAFALTAVLSVVACTEADNGNNTLAEDEIPGAQTTSSASATPQANPATTAPAPVAFPAGKPVPLEANDNAFVPVAFSVPAGDITIVMDNTGMAPHTFTQTDLKVDVNADAGKKATIKLKDVKPGTYHFICKYHEALKMVGDLTVT